MQRDLWTTLLLFSNLFLLLVGIAFYLIARRVFKKGRGSLGSPVLETDHDPFNLGQKTPQSEPTKAPKDLHQEIRGSGVGFLVCIGASILIVLLASSGSGGEPVAFLLVFTVPAAVFFLFAYIGTTVTNEIKTKNFFPS
ncbi:hypothetical protein KW803_03160, partial [Candidatus Saccharibacteria bacterium]|nr:hypothetical protein [Candidatus Saccharibacteria bacterium]